MSDQQKNKGFQAPEAGDSPGSRLFSRIGISRQQPETDSEQWWRSGEPTAPGAVRGAWTGKVERLACVRSSTHSRTCRRPASPWTCRARPWRPLECHGDRHRLGRCD